MNILLLASAMVNGLAYRDNDPAFGMMLFKALLVTALLLGLAIGLLLLAKRFGWLPGGAADSKSAEAVQIAAMRRLTPHTSLFMIRHGGRKFLLVESSRQISMHETTANDAEREA